MATFKEWQTTNLTLEQQEECNQACIRENERAAAAGATDTTEGWKFPSEEAQAAFLASGRDPVFVRYWDQYDASTK
jgi:hypothetical protein